MTTTKHRTPPRSRREAIHRHLVNFGRQTGWEFPRDEYEKCPWCWVYESDVCAHPLFPFGPRYTGFDHAGDPVTLVEVSNNRLSGHQAQLLTEWCKEVTEDDAALDWLVMMLLIGPWKSLWIIVAEKPRAPKLDHNGPG